MYRVFISYAGERPEAKQIASALEQEGINVFWDKTSLHAGDALCARIRDELKMCDEVCLLWTKEASDSPWVRFECAVAYAYDKTVVPLVDDSNTPLPAQYAVRKTPKAQDWYTDYLKEVRLRAAPGPRIQHTTTVLGPTKAPHQIISHCDSAKWTRRGFTQAPGYLLRGHLLPGASKDMVTLVELQGQTDSSRSQRKRGQDTLRMDQDARKRVDPQANSVWLLDSPASNTLVHDLIDSYRQWTSGGCLRWSEHTPGGSSESIFYRSGSDPEQRLDSKKLEPSGSNVAPYQDYFVIMSLPGSSLGLENCRSRVWILFGLHQKGTFVATELFRAENLPRLLKDISEHCGNAPLLGCAADSADQGPCGDQGSGAEELPYFEAVYRVPSDVDVNRVMVERCELVYLAKLRSRSEDATADEPEWQILPHFRSHRDRTQIPIQIAHLDLVSGCNFKCPQCIEAEMRSTRLKLSLETCVRVINDLRGQGCKKLGFYGGEPTLHGQFGLILDMAGKMGFDSTLVTNGSLLHRPEVRDAILRNRKCLQIRVSLDADTDPTHIKIHGRPAHQPRLEKIADAMTHLIHMGVHTSVSYLLVPGSGNVEELGPACRRWRGAQARQVAVRLATKPHGQAPAALSDSERDMVRTALRDHRDFISAPAWLRNLVDSQAATSSETTRECYSSYYRVVVSPWLPKGQKRPSVEDDYRLAETHHAWLSLCAYHRLDEGYGLPWPSDLNAWIRKDRQANIGRIDPAMCRQVQCCRQTYNRQVDDYLRFGLHAMS